MNKKNKIAYLFLRLENTDIDYFMKLNLMVDRE
jgi:hypothetical protein